MAFHAHAEVTPKEGEVLSKALVRAADLLEVSNNDLAVVVGVDLADLATIRNCEYVFNPDSRPLKAAVLFVRLFRSLDAIVGGNTKVARLWLQNKNLAFDVTPAEKIKNVVGLSEVVAYLDAKRAII